MPQGSCIYIYVKAKVSNKTHPTKSTSRHHKNVQIIQEKHKPVFCRVRALNPVDTQNSLPFPVLSTSEHSMSVLPTLVFASMLPVLEFPMLAMLELASMMHTTIPHVGGTIPHVVGTM